MRSLVHLVHFHIGYFGTGPAIQLDLFFLSEEDHRTRF